MVERNATDSQEDLLKQVRASLPPLDGFREAVRGDPDLELVVTRVEQIELLMEGIAGLRGTSDDVTRRAMEARVAEMRYKLRDSLLGS